MMQETGDIQQVLQRYLRLEAPLGLVHLPTG